MTGRAVFGDEFAGFIDDPGIRIIPGGRGKAALADVYVFPDLDILSPGNEGVFPAGGGRTRASRLIDFAASGGGALILGDEDSGKTSLLKVLAGRLLDSGFLPLFADGRTLRIPRAEDTDEFFLARYRSQYASGGCESLENETRGRRVLLIDNADRIVAGSGELGSFLSGLTSRFGAVFLTAASPPEFGELPRGFSVFGVPEGYAVFGIAELGYDLREELISVWIKAGGEPEDEENRESRRERMRGAVASVLERNLVPSYPVYLLTILQMADSKDPERPSASSYGQYYEYLITKSLRGVTDRENLTFFTAFLSELAYLLFSRRSRWISGEDVLALIDAQAPELKSLSGGPEYAIDGLLRSGILSGKESGYEFRYGYIYHYFTALYFSRNLHTGSVREEVTRLVGGLEDEEYANIVLFLTYLSGDPFLLEQIARNVEYAASAEEPYARGEEEQYLDELINEIEKLTDKDRKLREIRAEYLSSVSTPERQPIGFRTNGTDIRIRRRKEAPSPGSQRRSRFVDALLRISSGLLKGHPAEGTHGTHREFDENIYTLWLSSLGSKKREADRMREAAEGMEERLFEGGPGEELSYLTALYGLYMRIYLMSMRRLSLLTEAGSPEYTDTIPDELTRICAGLFRKERAPGVDTIGRYLEENKERKFSRALMRECASLRSYLSGEDEHSAKVAKLLDPGKDAGPYPN